MELLENDKHALRLLWSDPKERQRIQLCILQAIANGSDLSVREADSVLEQLELILEPEEEEKSRPDPAT